MKTFFSKLKGAFGDKSIAKPQDPSFIENIINNKFVVSIRTLDEKMIV